MMQDELFDKHVRERFETYRPEVPADMWERIAGKTRRPVPFLFWRNPYIMLALVIILGGISYLFLRQPSTGTQEQTPTLAGKLNIHNISSHRNDPQHIPIVGANKPVTTDHENQAIGGNIDTPLATSKETSEAVSHNNTDHSPSTIQSQYKKIAGSRSFDKLPVNKRNDFQGNIKNGLIMEAATDKSRETKADISTVNNPIASSDYTIKDLETALRYTYRPFANTSATPKVPKLAFKNMPSLPIPCPGIEANAAGNKKYVEIYAGPDKIFSAFSDTTGSAYLQARKGSVSEMLSFSAGVRITRVFQNGMSLRTGINYSQINEKFTYVNGHYVQVNYIINSNGDTTGTYSQSGTRYTSSTNIYRTVDIPLTAGYEWGNGRLHGNLNAGVMFNLRTWQQGHVLDTTYAVVDLSAGKSPYQLKKQLGVSFLGALSVYYKLTDRLHLLAEPYYRYSLSPSTKPDMTFKQRYHTLGVRLGIRFDLQATK
jgi:hypothetical protein